MVVVAEAALVGVERAALRPAAARHPSNGLPRTAGRGIWALRAALALGPRARPDALAEATVEGHHHSLTSNPRARSAARFTRDTLFS
jgi:hypothetical protein